MKLPENMVVIIFIVIIFSKGYLVSAKNNDEVESSTELLQKLPIFPLIEPTLWQQLIALEQQYKQIKNTNKKLELANKITATINYLKEQHPFYHGKDYVYFGGISWHKKRGDIAIPGTSYFPGKSPKNHPNEIELVLCTTKGKTHETLFTSKIKPRHLEYLLLLAGYKKGKAMFHATVQLPNQAPILLKDLLWLITSNSSTTELSPVNKKLIWLFIEQKHQHCYHPDNNGNLLQTWHNGATVLRLNSIHQHNKYRAKQHALLPSGTPVKIVLTPIKNNKSTKQ